MTAGYDPLIYVAEQDYQEYEAEKAAPNCDICGEKAIGTVYEIGNRYICENCMKSAISIVQRNLIVMVSEKYGHHPDGDIIINAVQSMIDSFDFSEYLADMEAVR